ncbi:MAG: response regulator [Anaerolineae bacterium]|nr:response regulator [Anaerolineae bacterium]
MGAYSRLQVRQIREVNQREIRSRTASGLAGILMVACLFWWWGLLAEDWPDLQSVALSSALIPTFFVARHWAERKPTVSAALVLSGCLATAVLSPTLLPREAVAPLLVLPGMAAAGLLGLPAGLGLTVLVLLLAVADLAGTGLLLGAQVLLVYLAVWAVLSPRDSVLDWSWLRSAEATYLAEQLRDRQGELNKALAALHVAYQLLERSNRELAVAHQEAEEARRLKEEFAANVSHELRTPLNIILGFAEIMHRASATYGAIEWPPMLRRDVAEIWRSACYISELVDDILELARVDALRMPVKRELSDLAAIIQETVSLAERLVDGKAISLELDLGPGLPPLYLDRTRMRQVLLNLLTNAIRFTDAGTVRVSAVARDEDVLVTVSDSGVGIPAHELELIFREFYRAQGPGERGGKGLGLAIARRFVQLHGGRIWAESRMGSGSQFHFTIPLQGKQVSKLAGHLSASVPGSHSIPVLAVSLGGHEQAYGFLARHLDGFDVIPASRPESVAELLDRHHPRALLVEGPLPQVATEAERLAESLPPGVPIIATTLPAPSVMGADECFDALLGKPVTRERLLSVLRRFVQSGSVLVVDDDRGFVQLVRRMLLSSETHFDVRWAYEGAEALEKLRAAPADVVLLDMVMEPMSGAEVARAIRQEEAFAGIPIVGVTGATGLRDEARISWVQVSKRGGMRDAEALSVLRAILEGARAEYVVSEPSGSRRTAAGPGTLACASAP